MAYEVGLKGDADETLAGLVVSEDGEWMTIRRAGFADERVMRGWVKFLRASGRSLMPEGLEQGLSNQDLADLLSFLTKSERLAQYLLKTGIAQRLSCHRCAGEDRFSSIRLCAGERVGWQMS